jgi:hypothetical protein
MPRFYVEGRIGISVGIEITAKDLDAAHARAKELKITDFVEMQGDFNDGGFEIGGINSASGAPKL